MRGIRTGIFRTRRRAVGFSCGGLLLAGCCLLVVVAALQGPAKTRTDTSPTQPVSRSVATQPEQPAATQAPTQAPTDKPTQAPTDTAVPATPTASPEPPTDTAVPPTATRVRITFTPAPQPTAVPVIQDTPTAAPPTQAPPPQAGGYVCPNGDACIKGNINSSGEKIYHFPGCGSYNQTRIDEGAGERYFTSSAEAEASGWRRAGNCP